MTSHMIIESMQFSLMFRADEKGNFASIGNNRGGAQHHGFFNLVTFFAAP